MKRIGFLILLCPLGIAQDKPHQITAEERAAYWRASAEFLSAQASLSAAKGKLADAIQAMKKECGELDLAADEKTGEPICRAKTGSAKQ